MAVRYIDAISAVALVLSLIFAYAVSKIFYNLFLHPLRSFPGPLLARATAIINQKTILDGNNHIWLRDLHTKYGSVVRLSPDELSFIEPEVWKEVYGHGSPFVKELKFYGPDPYGKPGLLRADNVNHARQRKLVSHAFSDKALRAQESLLRGYVGLLIERLKAIAAKNETTDIVEWYNFTTFDIMADLTFGEPLDQLSKSSYNPWVKAVFGFLKMVSILRVCRQWPGIMKLLNLMIPADIKAKRVTHMNFSKERVDARMAKKTDRPDIWTFVTRHTEAEGKGLSPDELHSNGSLFMLAGTETTATELSGLTYISLKNPEKLERLVNEVRGAFVLFEDMTMTKLSQLEFLNACLEEGLRMYPPLPIGLPRRTPDGGTRVNGNWVAGGTAVQLPIYAASYSPTNFKNPNTFVPERWMPEGEKSTHRIEKMRPTHSRMDLVIVWERSERMS